MGITDSLASLVEGAYAAALNDELWENWTDQLVGALGGSLGTFWALDTTTGSVTKLLHVRTNPKALDEFQTLRMGELDPQIAYATSRPRSGYYLDTDHVDTSNCKTAEFMRWMAGNVGVKHHMTTIARLDNGRFHVGISMHRTLADGATPIEEQRKLMAILPDITRAMNLGFLHGEKLLEKYWSGLIAARAEPALLLDDNGQVLRISPLFTALLSRTEGLDIRAGRLHAALPSDDALLQALITRVIARNRPRSGAMRVRMPILKAPLVLTAFPLPHASRFLAPAEAAALVTVVDPSAESARHEALWREAFSFTRREGELAGLLMSGHSLESAAATQNVTVHTVRVQLRHLFEKTGTSRQPDLIRLLSRVGRI